MRLQVAIYRNALPPVRIIHNTSASAAACGPASTIADLLSSVSTLVPLESTDGFWGLEDYAVEVRATADQSHAYECLHYQLIADVLQEDDEVVVRALSSEELKERRVGGRLQISGDGRHLVDGVSWGRRIPLGARGLVRPEVEIPPRKRRRIELEVEEDEGLLELPYPDEAGEDDDDDEEEFEGDDQDSDSADEEEEDLDESEGDEDYVDEPEEEIAGQVRAQADFDDLDADELEGTKTAFEHLQDGLKALLHDTSDVASPSARGTKRKRSPRRVSFAEAEDGFNGFSSPVVSTGSRRSSRIPDSQNNNRTGSLQSSNSVPSERGVASFDGEEASEREGVELTLKEDKQHSISSDQESSSSSGEDSGSSEDESDGSSSGDDSSDTQSESDSGDSEGEASSSATSIVFEPEETQEQPQQSEQGKDDHTQSGGLDGKEVLRTNKATSLATTMPPPPVPPGEGMSKTKRNNARKRRRKLLSGLQEAGVLGQDANFTTLREHLNGSTQDAQVGQVDELIAAGTGASSNHVDIANSRGDAGDGEDTQLSNSEELATKELAAKKSELLRRLNAQDPEEEDASNSQLQIDPRKESNQTQADQARTNSQTPKTGTASAPEVGHEGSAQRSKLDIASTRRILFGSLGVRNPKTPEAEQALREKLSKPARVAQPTPARDVAAKIFAAAEKPKTQKHWSKKLTISAVECQQVGKKIDVPPFPFQHPWQVRKERESRGYMDVEEPEQAIYSEAELNNEESVEDAVEDVVADEIISSSTINVLNPSPSVVISTALVAGQTVDAIAHDKEDFERLPDLKWSHFGEDAMIAFKELELGPNYEPNQSQYKKARIVSLNGDGSFTVEMLTANPTPSVQIDELTGQRVFSKFEMPFSDDQNDAEDRFRDLSFSDLIQPKLVEAAPVQDKVAVEVEDTEPQPTNAEVANLGGSPIIPESIPVAVPEIADNVSVAVSTQTRDEINGMIKDAGFDSGVDEQLLLPLSKNASLKSPTSPSSSKSKRSQLSDGGTRLSGGNTKAVNGKHEPREPKHTWISSPLQPSSPFRGTFDSDANAASSPPSESMIESVRYPHLSQLELDTSAVDRDSQAKSSSFQDAQIVPPALTVEDTTGFGDSNLAKGSEEPLRDESGDANFDYLGSEVSASQDLHVRSSPPPSEHAKSQDRDTGPSRVNDSAERDTSPARENASDSDSESLDSLGLPTLRMLTSSQRNSSQRRSSARLSQKSGDSNTNGNSESRKKTRVASSPLHSDAEDELAPVLKVSQSQQKGLSQIPEETTVVDLTQTSSPAKTDEGGVRASPSTRASRRKVETTGARGFKNALTGLGLRKTSVGRKSSSQG